MSHDHTRDHVTSGDQEQLGGEGQSFRRNCLGPGTETFQTPRDSGVGRCTGEDSAQRSRTVACGGRGASRSTAWSEPSTRRRRDHSTAWWRPAPPHGRAEAHAACLRTPLSAGPQVEEFSSRRALVPAGIAPEFSRPLCADCMVEIHNRTWRVAFLQRRKSTVDFP